MQLYDGQEYLDNAELPDLGSIQCICTTGGGIREYRGLSSDFDKMKEYVKHAPLLTGCIIKFEDTGETYEYFAYDKSWNLVVSNSSGGIEGVTNEDDIDFGNDWGEEIPHDVEEDMTDDDDIDFNNDWNNGN